jgi:hypothetical protein
MVEQLTVNQWVVGSNPTLREKIPILSEFFIGGSHTTACVALGREGRSDVCRARWRGKPRGQPETLPAEDGKS